MDTAPDFRLGAGGLFYRAGRAVHLTSAGRVLGALLCVAWLPLFPLAFADRLLRLAPGTILADPSVHVRLLVAVPLFLLAERVLAREVRLTVRQLDDDGYVAPDERARFAAMLAASVRLRDSRLAELALVALAFAGGVLSLLGVVGPGGVIHGLSDVRLTAARLWYGLVSLPVYQLMLLHALWRFAIWVQLLARLSRLRLNLVVAHPDRAGGLAFVAMPSVAFVALLLLGTSSVLAAGWGTQLVRGQVRLAALAPVFLVYVFAGLLLALAPLSAFTPRLFATQRHGRRRLASLVSTTARRFWARWVERPGAGDLLGSPDPQSQAALAETYETVARSRIFLFGTREVVTLVVAAALPVLPLLLTERSFVDLLRHAMGLLVGGSPR